MTKHKTAELIVSPEGRMYHVGLKAGDVAPNILLCGDPSRARKVAKCFDSASGEITSREYVTITGKWHGIPVTVMATGMGPDNTEMAIVELSQIVKNPAFIRIGSSSALKKEINIADVVISSGAVRLENTSLAYVTEGYPSIAHYEVTLALLEAAKNKGVPHHLGITATMPGFYGAQARKVPHFMPRDPDLLVNLEKMNVSNVEMETSCLFTMASFAGFRAGSICAVYGNRHRDEFVDENTKGLAEKRCYETGLLAFEILAKMDAAKKGERYWVPSMAVLHT